MKQSQIRRVLRTAAAAGMAFAASIPAIALADVLILRNGQRIEGHILDDTNGSYKVEAGSTTFQLPANLVQEVTKYEQRDTSLVLLGDSFLRQHDYEQARKYYQRAFSITKHKEVVLKRLKSVDEMMFRQKDLGPAEEAFRKKQYRAAADRYLALLAGHPDDFFTHEIKKKASESYALLAADLMDHLREGDAILELRKAVQIDPFNSKSHALVGQLLARQGKFDLAYEELCLSLDIDKTEPLALAGFERIGRNVKEYYASREGQGGDAKWKTDDKRLVQLFGDDVFEPGKNNPLYAAIRGGPTLPATVKFNLKALRGPATGGEGMLPAEFRSDRALSIFLQAYNAGPGAVTLYDGNVPYRETRNYVPRVQKAIDSISTGAMKETKYDGLIAKYANQFGFSPTLIKAIVKVESDFNPNCVSNKDARGLIQLVRVDWADTIRRAGMNLDYESNVFDPEWNLFVGCSYLRWLYDEYLPDYFAPEFG